MNVASKRFAPKFKVKKGDTVIVIAGNSKGQTGRILQVFKKKERVLVEGVNMVKKHQKPTETQKGGIMEIEAPIAISNVAYYDSKAGAASRVGRKIENGKIVRYSKKSGEIIK